MNEAVTIAKVRKETKITVPAGGWVILKGPDDNFNDHFNEHLKCNKDFPVNDAYERVLVGRVQTSKKTDFITAAELKQTQSDAEKWEQDQIKAREANRNKQIALDQGDSEKARKEHEAKVAEISKENDEIRYYGLSPQAKAEKIKEEQEYERQQAAALKKAA